MVHNDDDRKVTPTCRQSDALLYATASLKAACGSDSSNIASGIVRGSTQDGLSILSHQMREERKRSTF
jgi:hypothetical protein